MSWLPRFKNSQFPIHVTATKIQKHPIFSMSTYLISISFPHHSEIYTQQSAKGVKSKLWNNNHYCQVRAYHLRPRKPTSLTTLDSLPRSKSKQHKCAALWTTGWVYGLTSWVD